MFELSGIRINGCILYLYYSELSFPSGTVLRFVSKSSQPTEVAANFPFDPPLQIEVLQNGFPVTSGANWVCSYCFGKLTVLNLSMGPSKYFNGRNIRKFKKVSFRKKIL